MIEKFLFLFLIWAGMFFMKSIELDFEKQNKLIEQLYRRILDLEERLKNRPSCS